MFARSVGGPQDAREHHLNSFSDWTRSSYETRAIQSLLHAILLSLVPPMSDCANLSTDDPPLDRSLPSTAASASITTPETQTTDIPSTTLRQNLIAHRSFLSDGQENGLSLSQSTEQLHHNGKPTLTVEASTLYLCYFF